MEEVGLGWDLTKSACRQELWSPGEESHVGQKWPGLRTTATSDWGHPEKGTTSVKSEADPKPLMAAGSPLAPLLCWAVSLFRKGDLCDHSHPLCPQVPSLAHGVSSRGIPASLPGGDLEEGGRKAGEAPPLAAGLGAPLLSSLQPSSAVTSADLGGLPGSVSHVLTQEGPSPWSLYPLRLGYCSVHSR